MNQQRLLSTAADLGPREATVSDIRYISPTASGTANNGKTVLTLDQAVDNLTRTGGQWHVHGDNTITYSFLEKDPTGHYNNDAYLAGLTAEFSPFTADQRDAARASIQLWDDLIAPKFVEKNGGGADILFMNTGESGPGQAAAFIPDFKGKYNKVNGDVYVNAEQGDNFDLFYGGYGQTTLTHEIGHAIGLSHTGDYNASDDKDGDGKPDPITYKNDAEFYQDTYQYSIMSYFNSGNSGAFGYVNWATGYYQTPQTPMVHDIAAVQALYGADLTTRTDGNVYGFNSTLKGSVYDFSVNQNPFLSIYDAGGDDTLDLSGFTGGRITLDLRPGAFSTGYNYGDAAQLNPLYGVNFSQATWNLIYDGRTANPGFLSDNIGIAYNTIIENGVTGKGNDVLQGNDVANRLNGGAGNDTYTGGAGADTFIIAEKGGLDTITDFVRGEDKLDLKALHLTSFIGDSAFSGVAGQVHTYVTNGVNFVAGDLNGDGQADFVVNLGQAHLASSDILL